MITPYNFSICDTATWILDTESSIHICNSLQELQISRRFKDGERFLNVENGSLVPVLVLEVIKLIFESCIIMLNESHYCPEFRLNIISIGLLVNFDYEISIKKQICNIIENGVTIFCGHLNNGVYMLSQPVNVVY